MGFLVEQADKANAIQTNLHTDLQTPDQACDLLGERKAEGGSSFLTVWGSVLFLFKHFHQQRADAEGKTSAQASAAPPQEEPVLQLSSQTAKSPGSPLR